MLGSENSVDPDDLVNELKTDLVLLNGTLKKLDPDVDLWEVLRPLLAETGPAIAYAQRLGKQKIRMEKIRDDLVRKAEAAKMLPERSACSTAAHEAVRPFPFGCNQVAEGQSEAPAEGTSSSRRYGARAGRPRAGRGRPGPRTPVAAPSDRSSSSTPAHDFHVAPALPSRGRHGPRAAQTGADIVPSEVLPSWGELKRFSKRMDKAAYSESVRLAKWIFQLMLTQDGGPRACRMRALQEATPEPPVERARIAGFFSNRYLQFENIREAELNNNFAQIHIAYYRNEELVADRTVANKSRLSFIEWAVNLLRMRGLEAARNFSQDELLTAWDAIPSSERVAKAHPVAFFQRRVGVKLTMEDLFARAFPQSGAPAAAGAGASYGAVLTSSAAGSGTEDGDAEDSTAPSEAAVAWEDSDADATAAAAAAASGGGGDGAVSSDRLSPPAGAVEEVPNAGPSQGAASPAPAAEAPAPALPAPQAIAPCPLP